MNLVKDKLLKYFSNYESICPQSNYILRRFEEINKLIVRTLDPTNIITVDEEDEKVMIGGEIIKFSEDHASKCKRLHPTIKYFAPACDGLTKEGAFNGVKEMEKAIKQDTSTNFINKIACLLGGFDFESAKMKEEFRILSNAIIRQDDFNNSLLSSGQTRHPSSNFSDNNYFFNVMHFIQQSQGLKNDFENCKIVLRYPGHENYFKQKDDPEPFVKEYGEQKKVLEYRFPIKFLWMWANKDKVIHPVSLMAFRNLLKTEYGNELIKNINKDYTPEKITNMKFNEFVDVWPKISNNILKDLGIKEEDRESNLSNLSKLISFITHCVILKGNRKLYPKSHILCHCNQLKNSF